MSSYYFAPSGGNFKLRKMNKVSTSSPTISDSVEKDSTTEVAQIKQGWQSSKGYNQEDFNPTTEGGTDVTTSATKKLTVVTSVNGVEASVTVTKSFQKDTGTECEISDGSKKYELDGERCIELRQNGRTVAKIFDSPPSTM